MTLAALAVFVVALVGGAAFVTVRALAAWRSFREFTRAAGSALEALTGRLDALAAYQGPEAEQLIASVERLRRSTAQLGLLVHALGRVRAQWSALLAVYPRK